MGRERTDNALWACLLVSAAVFSAGTAWRPAGAGWDPVYDLGLYNAVYVAGGALCWRARHRVPGLAALAVALLLTAVGNAVHSTVVAPLDPEPFPSVADVFHLSSYVVLYVAVLGAVRGRVSRLQPSMCLDGLVALLGSAAAATAFLLTPVLGMAGEGKTAAVLTNAAYPLADVLLLVLLCASAAVLGLRADRGLLVLGAGFGLYLVADIWFVTTVAADSYVAGGWLDVLWLVGTLLFASAARLRGPGPTDKSVGSTLGWRVLALPLLCSFISVTVLAIGFGNELPGVTAWCAVGCWAASLVRTGLTFREIRDLRGVRAQARTDELTGLPNRRALYEGWQHLDGEQGALVLFDLDGFKEINDSLGHHVGDELLRQVAGRVTATVHAPTLAVRLGGDEFAVLLAESSSAGFVATRLQEALRPPFTVEAVRLHVGASFGVAHAGAAARSMSEVLRRADVAMYHAKRTRNGIETYVDGLGEGMADRLRTIDELRAGMARGELVIHLQTQVHPGSGQLTGMEALVRWQHPVRGLLSPAHLLPAAEQAGLMGALTETVLELSLAATATWWPWCKAPVSVNLSAANVTDLDLPEKVAHALRRHGLPPVALKLELVEDTFMKDPVRAQHVLRELRQLGVAIAIDDYGTGYSSLAYLKDLPADQLKIDRAFTTDLLTDPRVQAIVRHTVSLAHQLGLEVVAEGVEDAMTLALLDDLGCDAVQGFHVARPAAVDEVLGRLRRPVEGADQRTPVPAARVRI